MAKILVVDDMEEITDIVHYFLEEAGHDIVAVNSSKEALEELKKSRYEVLITDLLMPDLNGFELMQQAKEFSPEGASPKIIAISGGVSGLGTDTVLNTAALKADITIKKPFTREDISAAVDEVLAA